MLVDAGRTIKPAEGVDVRRSRSFGTQIDWSTYPPRQHAAEFTLDLAASAGSELDAIAAITDAVGARRTSPSALQTALAGRSRIERRALITGVVGDSAAGTCSVLEHGYLTRIERAHGLPTADRQVRDSERGTLFRDVVYTAFGLIVELDGRTFHSRALDRHRDLERDLDAAISGRDTVRLGWGQIYDTACSTAFKIGGLLAVRGWAGRPQRCPACIR